MNERNIIVIGDVMLDEYWNGTSNRISPEAPVPIVDDISVSHVLGGAANVALTSRVFNNKVTVYGCVGYDTASTIMTKKMSENDVKFNFNYSYENKTISKIRIMSDNHQLVRVDHGNISYPYTNKLENTPDVIIVSDYNKGTLHEGYLEYLIGLSCPVIVDPKGTDWEKYKGAYCITPNKKEFEEVYGEFSINRALSTVIELDLQGILVTLGAEGMHWVGKDGWSFKLESEAKEVFDVTGAGDTVIATFASFLHEGVEIAIRKANRAAGVVVGKVGTSVPTYDDVVEKVVFTNGCFDIIHSGHIALLQEAAKLGNRLIVGLNSDDSVERIKRKPINNEQERKKVLESIEGVDEVIIFNGDTPIELIEELKPNVIVKGGDYTVETVVGHDIVDEVVIFPTLEGKSTTSVIERIKNDN
jgi:D-beta-D-heptose 7-phosphate kinase/D-beta-D-heptose 1-phosphate adenosyltransferase